MRLTIIVFVVAIGLIADQLRFSGHYRRTALDLVQNSARQAISYVR